MVQARSRQMSTTAAVVPLKRRHRNVGRCEVTMEPDAGACGVADGPMQTPLVHVSQTRQVVPHAPQFVLLTWRSAHRPPHCVRPVGQVHLPSVHTRSLKPGIPVHELPHAPQLLLSVSELVQPPLHQIWDRAQIGAQTPRTHCKPAPHALLQRPQWLPVIWRSTQRPSQVALRGVGQVDWQRDSRQVVPGPQDAPQAPQ